MDHNRLIFFLNKLNHIIYWVLKYAKKCAFICLGILRLKNSVPACTINMVKQVHNMSIKIFMPFSAFIKFPHFFEVNLGHI